MRQWLKANRGRIITIMMMLMLGGLVYLLFRPRTLLLFHVADAMGLSPFITQLRSGVEGIVLPNWVVNCLPDALWAGAYVLLVDCVMRGRPVKLRLLLAAVIPVLGVVSEALQACGWLSGTFDWLDIVAYMAPYVLYLVVVLKKG